VTAKTSDPRIDQGNKALDGQKAEPDSGKTSVADARLDELFKQLFEARLIRKRQAGGWMAERSPLSYDGGHVGPGSRATYD
jgi:hypothetical protein